MSLFFSCSGINIELAGELPTVITKDVEHFFSREAPHNKLSYKYYFQKVSNLDVVQGMPIYQDAFRIVLKNGDLETRIYTQSNMSRPYAIYEERENNIAHIRYLDSVVTSIDMHFIEFFVIEKCLLNSNAIILHSCFVEYGDGAIIFTAPSGTGKSTQGQLWKQYENAETINGDRSIVWYTDKCTYACGLPFCGSSVVNRNKILPIHAIVVIEQASGNVVENISKNEAIKKIFSETTINYWNPHFVQDSLSVIERIVNTTKIYRLNCTISKEAVSVLKEVLFKDILD